MAEDKIIIEYEARTKQLDAALAKTEKELRDVEEASKKAFGGVSKEADKAGKPIDNTTKKIKVMSTELNNQQKSVNGLSDTFKGLATNLAAVVSVGAALALGKQILDVTSQFQKLEAVLTNTLGSKGEAKNALQLIKDFAATTNFSVLELTEGFIKLTNSGFKPTKSELTKLADLANSTGKSFDQLVEAILDANTFQFERLKEFGIKAAQEGNKIKFTFKGVTTEVDKSSDSVQKYLLSLGDLKGVAGSTAAISATLGGQISNLGDAYDSLLLSIGTNANSGVSGAISGLSFLVNELSNAFKGYDSVFTPISRLVRGSIEIYSRLADSVSALFSGIGGLVGASDGTKTFFTVIEKGAKIALLPTKLLVLGITTLVDVVNLFKKAITGDISVFDIAKIKADANKFIEIITLSDGAFIAEKEEVAKEEVSIEQKKQAAITAEQIKAAKERAAALDKLRKILADNKRKQEFDFDVEAQKEVKAQMEQSDADLLQSVKDNADDVIGVKEEYNKEILILDDQLYEKQQAKAKENSDRLKEILKGSFDIAVDLVNGFFDISQQKRQMEFDDQLAKNDESTNNAIASLQQQLDNELITKETFNVKKRELEIKQQREESKIKKKAFESEKRAALVQVAIDTAAAIVKTLANLGYPAGLAASALAAAAGLAQAAIISSQPVPKFKDGVIDLKGKGTGTSDSIPAMLSKGESVMTARETQVHRPILTAIRDNSIDDYIKQSYVLPALRSIDVKNNRERASRDMNTNRLLGEIAQNSTDTSRIESLLKKNKQVGINNADAIGKAIYKEMQINSTWFK